MKNLIKTISGFFFLLIISCSPQINYLGDSYTPTKEIDIFFDENDIEKEFKVMGVMKNEGDEFEVDDAESVKEAMVKKAKAVGADAILFVGFYSDRVTNDHSNIDNVKKIYEAKLLKYR
jgi:hypothetical protein